ncbi:universal stress protein [Phenylobacterium sp.]|jgi:nucleotide-binding universal stress UspA family protein|uniref:universal stress protein n=1 Tax=Phenylobacterium sp. TaxID=1871053 RepID=UPI00120B241D|nr:universal stress protein [Phenylobacterium sp.]THD52529.1 MAG: universal stress protein [Phenylobacterium sp.]
MTLRTIMVQLELGRPHAGVLAVAGDLGERFQAEVIGIAACQPMRMDYGDVAFSGDFVQVDRDEIDRELKAAELDFRTALGPRATSVAWRSTITNGSLCDYFAREARSADLIITHVSSTDLLNPTRRINTGGLVMQAGRPVLIVPGHVQSLKIERAVLAWKDTREARRAALDALPLLKAAGHVAVVAIATQDKLAWAQADLDDVLGWLRRHGVEASQVLTTAAGDSPTQLQSVAREQKADLIVAGAYGRSRLQEWALGGVTGDLLMHANICSLVSH